MSGLEATQVLHVRRASALTLQRHEVLQRADRSRDIVDLTSVGAREKAFEIEARQRSACPASSIAI